MNKSVIVLLPVALFLLAAPQPARAQSPAGISGFTIPLAADTTIDVAVLARWNMISVPLNAADMHKDTLFPSSVSGAFLFDGTYHTDDVLDQGTGYWLKFDTAETIPLFGSPVYRDTIDLAAGWNLVGSISAPVPASSVEKIPGDLTLSRFWEFGGGYHQTGILLPGKGYWVRSSAGGAIVLDAGAAASPRAAADPFSGMNTLTIEDARGNSQTLAFGESAPGRAGAAAEMPPPPPPGVFDARFADGNWAESYAPDGEQTFAVSLRSAAWPVTVRWKMSAAGRDGAVLNGSVRMSGNGSAVLAEEGPISIRAGVSAVPASYNLGQNYPNPFNPATTITYDLPAGAAVKLTVYDLLGREVAVLAEGMQDAGVHDVVFDASGYTSGIYFYRLDAGSFTAVRKLVLMK